MKRIKLIGLAIMAIFALTAFAATIANAEETKILPEPTAASPLTNTGTGGRGRLLTLGRNEVSCTSTAGKGSFTSFNLGTFETTFKGCTSTFSSTCTGLLNRAGSGEITLLGTVHYWLAKSQRSGTLIGALVFLIAPFHFGCTALGVEQLVLVLGCAAAEATPSNVLTNLTKDVFIEQAAGMPDIRSVLPQEARAEIPCFTTTQVNETGAFEEGAQLGTIENSKFEQGRRLISVLLMNP